MVSLVTLFLLLRALGSIRRIEEVGHERLKMLREQRDRLEFMYEERGLLLEMLRTQKRLMGDSQTTAGPSVTAEDQGSMRESGADRTQAPEPPRQKARRQRSVGCSARAGYSGSRALFARLS